MARLIIPLVLIGASIGLFMLYTDPAYQDVKALQKEAASYDEALDKSQELKRIREQLISRRNAFPVDGLQKLERILPDNVDNIRLIIDINGIAARHLLSIRNIEMGEVSDSATSRSDLAVGASGSAIGSVDLGFSISASYDDFLAFLQDLEHSLRVVDVESISFTTTDEDTDEYKVSIRTYWLH